MCVSPFFFSIEGAAPPQTDRASPLVGPGCRKSWVSTIRRVRTLKLVLNTTTRFEVNITYNYFTHHLPKSFPVSENALGKEFERVREGLPLCNPALEPLYSFISSTVGTYPRRVFYHIIDLPSHKPIWLFLIAIENLRREAKEKTNRNRNISVTDLLWYRHIHL